MCEEEHDASSEWAGTTGTSPCPRAQLTARTQPRDTGLRLPGAALGGPGHGTHPLEPHTQAATGHHALGSSSGGPLAPSPAWGQLGQGTGWAPLWPQAQRGAPWLHRLTLSHSLA